jgi:hypothetical protein
VVEKAMWDIFISHAGEDKESVARPLFEHLRSLGVKVWYDEFTLVLGDSLRQSIDNGLANSKFGVVILSPNFFSKNWPQNELDGLFSRETSRKKIILPVWHNIDRDTILQYSPMLADRYAANTNKGLDSVIKEIMKVVDPLSSYLTDGKLGVQVVPLSMPIRSKEWASSSFFTVINKTIDPVYSAYIKILLISDTLKTSNIKIEPFRKSVLPLTDINGVYFDPDILRIDGIDSSKNKTIIIIISILNAHESRTLAIENSKIAGTTKDQLLFEIHKFENNPPIMSKKTDSIGYPVSFKEPFQISSTTMLLSRKQ